jgi:Rnl2 family RNA ligase
MAKFYKKYPSLINHYHVDDIHYWLNLNPGLVQATYGVQEKIHGANISFYISPDDSPIRACSRNRVLPPEENFFDLPNTLPKYEREFAVLKAYAIDRGVLLRVYGEYYGGAIQTGVDYGEEKKIVFYDMKVDNNWVTPKDFYYDFESMDEINLPNMVVPCLSIVSTLKEALAFNSEFDSGMSEATDNLAEGVVIKPWNLVQESPEGSIFRVKKKNEKFKEKMHRKKPPAKIDATLLELQEEFGTYLTDMRLQAIYSKFGRIWKPRQIGEYIKYMMDDATEDFFKDRPDVKELSKKTKKTVFRNAGKIIMPMLKKTIATEV